VQRTVEPCRQAMKDAGISAQDIDDVVLVGGQTRMPKVQQLVTQLFGKEPHKGVNPDEVVAVGAAIQGGVLAGDVKDVVLLDVTPLSLGVETQGGVTTVVISRNTTIPTKKSEIFTTATDHQISVEVHVLQGERPLAKDNRTLGRFHLSGIPAAPRGVPQIEVAFDIDANGILNVSARDTASGKQQQITITASSGLTKEEVERLVRDAEAHAADDARRKEEIELRNQADALVYSTERSLAEHGARLDPNERQSVEHALAEAREAMRADDIDRIRLAQEQLTRAAQVLAQATYRDAHTGGGPPTAGGPPPGGAPPEDDVVDAEFEDTDERRKAS
jgi:molecular chaperone DnaK